MHNPTRQSGRRNKKQRIYDPHAGTKASDVRRAAQASSAAPVGDRQSTGHGYIVPVFSNDDFSAYYEMIYAGNHTGFGSNEEADRVVRVLSGNLYLTEEITRRDSKPERKIRKLPPGSHVALPRGKKYGYGTSGTDFAEVYIVETQGYADGWHTDEEATFNNESQFIEKPVGELKPPRDPRRTDTKAMQQAEMMKARKGKLQRRKGVRRVDGAADNPNSATSIGVNPRPMGPPPADD